MRHPVQGVRLMFAKTKASALPIEAQAQSLALGWMRHFRQQDMSLPYTACETAYFRMLDNGILLVGIVDAEGDDFFSEYKTASPRGAKTWKREWILSVQALTYGLLTGGEKRFLVRKAFKSATPTYDHEWFAFDPRDLQLWEDQVQAIASEILALDKRGITPWQLNLEHGCFAYGPNYPCPFWHFGCTKHNFDSDIPGATSYEDFPEFTGTNRSRLLDVIHEQQPELVLSSSRIKNWMRCREMFRRLQHTTFPPSDAMLLGSRFHELIAAYNRSLIKQRKASSN